MRRPITKDEMERYLAKRLSVSELQEFEVRLREAGMEANVRKPSSAVLFESLRPGEYEELFDEDTLLAYVKGEVDPKVAAAIQQLRRVDANLEETLSTMEAAKRQVEASLRLAQSEAKAPAKKRNWRPVFGWSVAVAAVAMVVYPLLFRKASSDRKPSPLVALLSTQDLSADAPLSGIAQQALASASIETDPEVKAELVALASPTKDIAKMSPAMCLVLPDATTKLSWSGIQASNVTCSLRDAAGTELAKATVAQKNAWTYKKPLAEGDYEWSAEWIGRDDKLKQATRKFRVEDNLAVREKLSAIHDPVGRSVILAEYGYTYQSLQMLDAMVNQAPSIKGLKELRDAVARQAVI